ncbi:MAG: YtxH domain-containing protein [Rikenellaceae bacterium]
MKKACVILSSIIGGALVGSVVALLTAPKSGKELREDLQEAMMSKLNMLQDQVKSYGCNCELEGENE